MDFTFSIAKCGICSVPGEMIAGAKDGSVKRLDGKEMKIAKIEHHFEVEVKEIRLVQLAWLFKNRHIEYAFLDEKKEKLALGVKK